MQWKTTKTTGMPMTKSQMAASPSRQAMTPRRMMFTPARNQTAAAMSKRYFARTLNMIELRNPWTGYSCDELYAMPALASSVLFQTS